MAPQTRPLDAVFVAHAALVPSQTNPRKRFDPERLQELADSMAESTGILEPLVVRRLDPARAKALGMKPVDGFFEIIAGERRWRAAAKAQLVDIPVVIREVADDQVIRLQLIENKNREDIHPLEEAAAMNALLKLSAAETPKTIAASIGMSERYVQNRLHYLALIPEVATAFLEGRIAAGHADLLIRLSPADQARAFKEGCWAPSFDWDDETNRQTRRVDLRSVRDLGEWIKDSIRLELAPTAPEMAMFPEVQQAVNDAAVVDAPRLLELIVSPYYDGKTKPAPLTSTQWRRVKKGEACDHQARGVIVLGRRRGEILTVCTGSGHCKKHFADTIRQTARPSAQTKKAAPAKKTPAQLKLEAEQARQRERARLWDGIRFKATALVLKALKTVKPGPIAFRMIADALERGSGTYTFPKHPTLADLLAEIVEEEAEYGDSEAFERLFAKPLGVNLKPLFAEAAAAPVAPVRKAGKKR